MKNSLVFAIVTACVLTACNKKADEATPETTTENAAVTEVVENAEAAVNEAVKPAEEKVEEVKAE